MSISCPQIKMLKIEGGGQPAALSLVISILLVVVVVDPVWGMNDPMQPPEYMISSGVEKELVEGELKLQMILISPHRKTIVLNNKTLGEGDVVAGAKVISIEKEHVVIKRKGKVVDLRLNPIKSRERVVK